MSKLSIIVPIYNVENYLNRCIDSILKQSFKDFEAILIDDGSPDRCGDIIEQYAKIDPRIITIHQKNQGVSAARNAGLKIAKGEYIGFVDPDDWIEPTMYSVLIQSIERYKSDIASCSWFYNDSIGVGTAFQSRIESKVMSRDEFLSHLFDMPITISGSVCSKLFRRKNIRSVFPENYCMGEDHYFLTNYCRGINRAIYLNEPLYHVYNRRDSAMRKESGRIALGIPVRREIIDIAGSINKRCGLLAEKVYINQCFQYSSSKMGYKEEYYTLAKKELCSYMKKNPFCIMRNTELTIKQKVFFLTKLFTLLN